MPRQSVIVLAKQASLTRGKCTALKDAGVSSSMCTPRLRPAAVCSDSASLEASLNPEAADDMLTLGNGQQYRLAAADNVSRHSNTATQQYSKGTAHSYRALTIG